MVSLTDLNAGATLTVDTGAGNDQVTTSHSNVTGALIINAGDGNDSVTVKSDVNVGGDATITGGGGNDSLTVGALAASKNAKSDVHVTPNHGVGNGRGLGNLKHIANGLQNQGKNDKNGNQNGN